jgi:hypothetical protein
MESQVEALLGGGQENVQTCRQMTANPLISKAWMHIIILTLFNKITIINLLKSAMGKIPIALFIKYCRSIISY